jgi:hypothetical protein
MEKEKNTLGGFEAFVDTIIPNFDRTPDIDDDVEPIDDDDLDDIKNQTDPVADKVRKATKTEEPLDDEEDDDEPIDEPKRKPGRPKKEEVIEEPIDEPDEDDSEVVTNFFDAMSEELGWEFDEDDEKPKTVPELINYFKTVIEENSKPDFASEEIEALDAYVKQGGDLRKYLQIDAELDLDDIDLDEESNQKAVVKMWLKEKGFSSKQIEKKISKYEDAGLLEDEAQDAIEDLKEIREQRKEQLLKEQEKAHKQYQEQQRTFYTNVVDEIKGLKNIRGIAIPEKDKKVLIDYILKPDADGRTKYQKDYAKGGVKNLIESAYFTMNADKLLEAAKREGNNKAVEKFRNSLKSTSVSSKSKQAQTSSNDESIWFSAARKLRIS